MSKRFLLLIGVMSLAAAACAVTVIAQAQPPAWAAKAVATPFGKNLVLVTCKDNIAVGLELAEIRNVGGRAFVVGREAKENKVTRPRWGGAMVMIWLPLDDVTQFVEFPPEDKKADKKADEDRKKE